MMIPYTVFNLAVRPVRAQCRFLRNSRPFVHWLLGFILSPALRLLPPSTSRELAKTPLIFDSPRCSPLSSEGCHVWSLLAGRCVDDAFERKPGGRGGLIGRSKGSMDTRLPTIATVRYFHSSCWPSPPPPPSDAPILRGAGDRRRGADRFSKAL